LGIVGSKGNAQKDHNPGICHGPIGDFPHATVQVACAAIQNDALHDLAFAMNPDQINHPVPRR